VSYLFLKAYVASIQLNYWLHDLSSLVYSSCQLICTFFSFTVIVCTTLYIMASLHDNQGKSLPVCQTIQRTKRCNRCIYSTLCPEKSEPP